jgi:hypothetical protein
MPLAEYTYGVLYLILSRLLLLSRVLVIMNSSTAACTECKADREVEILQRTSTHPRIPLYYNSRNPLYTSAAPASVEFTIWSEPL